MSAYNLYVPPFIEHRLADLVVDCISLRSKITKANHRIETLLSIRPETAGVHLSEGLYRIDDYPLRVHFSIDSILGEVEILELDLWLD